MLSPIGRLTCLVPVSCQHKTIRPGLQTPWLASYENAFPDVSIEVALVVIERGVAARSEVAQSRSCLRGVASRRARLASTPFNPRPEVNLSMRRIPAICFVLLLVLLSATAHASLRVASWNVQHLGWGSKKNLDAVASVINRFDLVAIEEVMDPAAVEKLAARLSSVSDSEWNSVTSRAIPWLVQRVVRIRLA
jgi:hypothetical protein